MITLDELGYTDDLARYRQQQNLSSFEVGRISAEHRERYLVLTENGVLDAEVIGHLRFAAADRSGFPAVGDWVAVSVYNETDAIIHDIYPRKGVLERQAVGKFGEKQIMAANVDYALIMQAVDRDFNLNRMERYLTIAHASQIEPIILLSKCDLVEKEELASRLGGISKRIRGVPVLPISNQSRDGLADLYRLIRKGKTYCVLGSSGVGKSTLINHLAGVDLLDTSHISHSTGKGRHTTSRREMVILPNGGILIDNPGIREVGLADTSAGLETTFDQIQTLAGDCRYSDCVHIREEGCAVRAAVEKGDLDRAAYENYLKMEREKNHFQASIAEKRKKDKEFGKMVKAFKKSKKRNEE